MDAKKIIKGAAVASGCAAALYLISKKLIKLLGGGEGGCHNKEEEEFPPEAWTPWMPYFEYVDDQNVRIHVQVPFEAGKYSIARSLAYAASHTLDHEIELDFTGTESTMHTTIHIEDFNFTNRICAEVHAKTKKKGEEREDNISMRKYGN